jgi:hypothetical protein
LSVLISPSGSAVGRHIRAEPRIAAPEQFAPADLAVFAIAGRSLRSVIHSDFIPDFHTAEKRA